MRRFARFGVRVLGLAGLALLAACNGDPDETAPSCPLAALLPDAVSLTRYNGRGTDLTDLVLTGRMLDIKGACGGRIGGKQVKAHAHVEMVLTRGPAATSNAVDVPYSVGIVRNGAIIEKNDYAEHVVFPANVNTVRVTGQEVTFLFPTPKGVTGPNYHVYFLFQLTQAELEANRHAQR